MTKKKTTKKPSINNSKKEAEYKNLMKNAFGENLFMSGVSGPNPGGGVTLSQLYTLFKNTRWYLISNLRQIVSQVYVEYGVIQTLIDLPVDDGLRGGAHIKSKQLSSEDIDQLETNLERENLIHGVVGQTIKWNRLYGGAATLIIDGTDWETPFIIENLKQGDPLSFRSVDLWELYATRQNTDDYSEAIDVDPSVAGSVVIPDAERMLPGSMYNYYGKKIHASRVMIMTGLVPPSFVRPRMRGWGMSELEKVIRSLNQYLKSNDLTFEVLDEYKIDVFKIKGYASTILTPQGKMAVDKRIRDTNVSKNYNKAIAMDSQDDYIQKQLTFAGLADTMKEIRMQLAADLRMPLTKLFGISAQGFNSGEDDLENYNAMIESTVREKAKPEILKLVEIKCQQLFGFIPDDLKIEFDSLRVLTSEQEENVKTQKMNRLLAAFDKGLIGPEDFKDACNKDQLLPVQLDPSEDLLEMQTEPEDDETAEVPDEAAGSKIKVVTKPKSAPEAKA